MIFLLLFAILSLEKNTAESILVPSLLPKIIKSHLARFALWYWLLLHPNAVKACSYTPIPLRSQTGWASQRVESPSKTMPITGLKRSLPGRSEEHTSELQSHSDLVCRLLLEKKKTTKEI